MPRILVLGGHGFIGRHAVAALNTRGVPVTIGTRTARLGQGINGEMPIRLEERLRASDWCELVAEFDVILNCVGILRPVRDATYDRIHHQAPSAIAEACTGSRTRFVHVSALGLGSRDRSGFLTSKRNGEQAIQSFAANWIIVRPSLLDGDGGYGAAWLRGVARLPIFAVPADARGRIAALMAGDAGLALAQLCLASDTELGLADSRIFELGGTQSFIFEQYIRGLRRRYSRRRSIAIPIPGIAARLAAHVCDLLRLTPFSFGHWELLRRDNVPRINRLPELLGRDPTPVIR